MKACDSLALGTKTRRLLLLGGQLQLLRFGLLPAGLLLLLEGLLLQLALLHLVDCLDQHTLILVRVTLSLAVEEVVHVLVVLLLTVLAEQAAEDTLTTHPEDLAWHPCLLGTTSLADSHVATLALSSKVLGHASAGVHLHGLADDKAILDELADVEAGIG